LRLYKMALLRAFILTTMCAFEKGGRSTIKISMDVPSEYKFWLLKLLCVQKSFRQNWILLVRKSPLQNQTASAMSFFNHLCTINNAIHCGNDGRVSKSDNLY
jgi:hypothetical protein